MIRIYWNKKEAVDGLVWSVDQGDISTEVNVKEIICYIPLVSHENLSASENDPKGWMQTIADVKITFSEDKLTAYIGNKRV